MYDYQMPSFPSVTHFAVTVSDLDRSVVWYEALFDVPPFLMGDESTYRAAIWLEPMFALHEHRKKREGDRFDELRVGLDHIAFGCVSRQELEGWAAKLTLLGIEHSEIVDAFYGSGLAFRDPDNIQLEFFSPVGTPAPTP
jgi:catechol-2,3-dioxygenase